MLEILSLILNPEQRYNSTAPVLRFTLAIAQARYNFSLTAPAHLTALFNTPQVDPASEAPAGAAPDLAGGLVRRSFQPTPPMSSYLVAFVVGNLTNASALVHGAGAGDERGGISKVAHNKRD